MIRPKVKSRQRRLGTIVAKSRLLGIANSRGCYVQDELWRWNFPNSVGTLGQGACTWWTLNVETA